MSAAVELVTDAEDLGEADEIEVIARLLPLAGCTLADIGCGGGRLSRELVARGARVVGVEPDPAQAARNREAPPLPGLRFIEAPGQSLPLDDETMDAALFSYSLHHVPPCHMAGALGEAIRILRRESGALLVLEPMLSGSMEAVYRPFHDESAARRAAYQALQSHAAPRFATGRELRWHEEVRYDSFEAFLAETLATSHMSFTRERVDTPEVRARFEAGRSGDGFVFIQHLRANLFRGRLD